MVDNNTPKPDTSAKVDTFYKKEDLKNITKEQFAALKSNLLDTFLKKNGFPRKYTAKNIKEMVAADKIKPTAVWITLTVMTVFRTPVSMAARSTKAMTAE